MGLKKKNDIRLIKRILFLMVQKALFFETRNYETALSSVNFLQLSFPLHAKMQFKHRNHINANLMILS